MKASSLSSDDVRSMISQGGEYLLCFDSDEWDIYKHRYQQLRIQQKGIWKKTYWDGVREAYHWIMYKSMLNRAKHEPRLDAIRLMDRRFLWKELRLADKVRLDPLNGPEVYVHVVVRKNQ